jgi:hypothetical protein
MHRQAAGNIRVMVMLSYLPRVTAVVTYQNYSNAYSPSFTLTLGGMRCFSNRS